MRKILFLFLILFLLSGCISTGIAQKKQNEIAEAIVPSIESEIEQIEEKGSLEQERAPEEWEIVYGDLPGKEPEEPQFERQPELDGEWGCDFRMSEEDKELFSKLKFQVDLACEKAIIIQETLGLPLRPYYNVSFGDSLFFSAWYSGNGNMVLTRQGLADRGLQNVILHEFTHSALEEVPLPIWFEEGLCERTVDIIFKRDSTINTKTKEPIETLVPFDVGDVVENNVNYRYANYTVKKFIEKYEIEALREILLIMREKYLRGELSYSNDIHSKNEALVESMRQATGDQGITLNSIVYPSNN